MNISAVDFIRSLETAKDWKQQWEWIDAWAAEGQVGLLRELGEALHGRRASAIAPSQRRSFIEHVEVALALTPSLASAEALIEVAATPSTIPTRPEATRWGEWHDAYLASLLASGQRAETLSALFATAHQSPTSDEILACLIQEMVVRGIATDGDALSDFYERRVVGVGHPLGWLPTALVVGERELRQYLPVRHGKGSSCAIPFGPSERQETPSTPDVPFEYVLSVTDEVLPETARAAVANWMLESGGQSESRLFALERPIVPEEVSVTGLFGLGLMCLQGAQWEGVHLRRVPLREILNTLFSAAASGAAYNSGHYAAYGRLDTWRSVAALIGASEGASFDEVVALAEACHWFLFDAASEWFYQVAWDLGVAVLRPGRDMLAVLAATDTD